MKELSIEEKAKRYDEAIAYARLLLKTIGNATLGNLVLKNEFENMFPELKESKNERIRKVLLGHFSRYQKEEVFLNNITMGDIVAWLEKQGEQKPADKVEPIVVRDFNSVFSREQVEEIDKRIEESQRLYNAKLRYAMRKVEDFPMTD